MQRQEPVLGLLIASNRSMSMQDPAAPQSPQDPSGPNRKSGFMQVVGAVFWSFFGIRRKAAGERDMVTIKPLHVVIAGLLCAAIFVGTLVVLVTIITRKG